MSRSVSHEPKGSSTAYTIIFLLALVTWFLLRRQESYSKWISNARAQEWATYQGITRRRNLNSEEGGDEAAAPPEPPESLTTSSLSSTDEKEKKEEKEDDDKENDEDDDKENEDNTPKVDDMEKAREELTVLERAFLSRKEEARLFEELINTRDVQVQLHDPPPPGYVDELFMQNFNQEVQKLIEKWISDFQQLKSLAEDKSIAADDNLKKLSDWEERWEKRELEKMVSDAKVKIGYSTITGRKANPTSIITEEGRLLSNGASSSSASTTATEEKSQKEISKTSQETVTVAKAENSKDNDNDFGVDAATPLRVELPSLTASGSPLTDADTEELLATLKSLETNAMQWTESSKKQVVVLGERVYIGRDMGVYKWAFTRLGFNVRLGSSSTGRMSTKLLQSGDWSVLLCLALNTEHCFTSTNLDRTKRYQRINRVQGLRRVLWSKDSFCDTVSASARGYAIFKRYIFDCWIFPREYSAAAAYAQAHPKSQFIVKPLSMGGGMGISVVDGEKGLHKVRRQTHIVQNYLHNPMLIKGKKWDLRTYVLVTSVLPLRAYVYNRGLVRFASQAYDPTAKHGGKKTQFLTNTSINKHYVRKGNVTDITWGFDKLQAHLDSNAPGTYDKLLRRMQAAISIVLLSAERSWRKYFDSLGGEMCGNCYQLMGVDLIVDADLQPRVIEVNGQPSMQLTKSEEDHYTTTKKNMIRDLCALVYNEDRVAGDLTREFSTFDREIVAQLQTRDHEYLLEYHREKLAMGGWLPVYPSHRHFFLHLEFFKYQKNPPTEESRMTLHTILGALEQRLFDNGGPKPRAQRESETSGDEEEEGPVIEDEGVVEELEVEEESNESLGD